MQRTLTTRCQCQDLLVRSTLVPLRRAGVEPDIAAAELGSLLEEAGEGDVRCPRHQVAPLLDPRCRTLVLRCSHGYARGIAALAGGPCAQGLRRRPAAGRGPPGRGSAHGLRWSSASSPAGATSTVGEPTTSAGSRLLTSRTCDVSDTSCSPFLRRRRRRDLGGNRCECR